MLPEIAPEELDDQLESLASDLLRRAEVDRPPVDALCVARALGMTVALDDRQSHRARYVRLARHTGRSGASILLRPDPRRERRQWAIAHEIGEHSAWRLCERLGIDPRAAPPATRERLANQLAARLLLPGSWLAADGGVCGWDLPWLKRRYDTASHELIARRMLELPPPVVITIFDEGAVTLRRANVAGRAPGLSPLERDCWRRVHASGEAACAWSSLGHVQAWPVHEPEFKREILRIAIDVECFTDDFAETASET